MYYCIYCHSEHSDNTRSKEHIIPEVLHNKNYCLSNVCRRLNNYMANSFEKQVVKSQPITHIDLRMFPMPNKVHAGTERSESTGQEYVHWIENGKGIRSSKPRFEMISQFPILLHRRNGTEVRFDLKLPFEVRVLVASGDRLTPRAQMEPEANEKIRNYLKEFGDDPSINTELQAFLQQNDAQLPSFDSVILHGVRTPITDDVPYQQTVSIDQEKWLKFYMKIAWTYAARVLESSVLDNPVANWILWYITTGDVPEASAMSSPDLFNPVEIEGKSYFFWRDEPTRSLQRVTELSNDARPLLEPIAEERIKSLAKATNHAYTVFKPVDDDILSHLNEYQYHSLEFVENVIFNKDLFSYSLPCTCKIALFGGIFEGYVHLSNRRISPNVPPLTLKFETDLA